MSLRVIAGSAKGCRLKRVPGNDTRPVMDRVKEALFSILGSGVVGATFIDLFAGTGSVGIEALSRGAGQVVFVENARSAVRTIQANLEITRLGEDAIIRRTDVFAFLKRPPDGVADYIYIAPPQYAGTWLETLKALDGNPAWISKRTTVIVQMDPSELDAPFVFEHLALYDQRRYGKTVLLFFAHRLPATAHASEEETVDG